MVDEQDITERYLFFSKSSNGAGKTEFLPQSTCLNPHLHVKYKSRKYNK